MEQETEYPYHCDDFGYETFVEPKTVDMEQIADYLAREQQYKSYKHFCEVNYDAQ